MDGQHTTSEILRRAAQVVRERGWTQHVLVDRYGRVCALGALHFAEGRSAGSGFRRTESVIALANVISQRFGLRLNKGAEGNAIAIWNNAPERTPEEVALTMEFAALCAEQAEKVGAELTLV
jgi:hypothetical protein